MLPVPVMEAVVRRATPKSMIFTVPSWLMKMFAGLMSRWTMPAWCAWARPASTCTMIADLALEGHGRRRAHRLLEVHALQELHRDEGRAVGVVPEVEDVHHVGVGHPRDGLGLALEALLQLGVVGDAGDHHLEGDVALEDGVVGEVDDAHRALAQRLDDVVLADAARKLLDRPRRR